MPEVGYFVDDTLQRNKGTYFDASPFDRKGLLRDLDLEAARRKMPDVQLSNGHGERRKFVDILGQQDYDPVEVARAFAGLTGMHYTEAADGSTYMTEFLDHLTGLRILETAFPGIMSEDMIVGMSGSIRTGCPSQDFRQVPYKGIGHELTAYYIPKRNARAMRPLKWLEEGGEGVMFVSELVPVSDVEPKYIPNRRELFDKPSRGRLQYRKIFDWLLRRRDLRMNPDSGYAGLRQVGNYSSTLSFVVEDPRQESVRKAAELFGWLYDGFIPEHQSELLSFADALYIADEAAARCDKIRKREPICTRALEAISEVHETVAASVLQELESNPVYEDSRLLELGKLLMPGPYRKEIER